MAAPHQHPTTTTLPPTPHTTSSTSTTTQQPTQPSETPVELDSHPITAHSPPHPHPQHQQSTTTTTTTSTDNDSTERRPSIYTDPESMAKLRAERSSDPAVVDGPAANEPAAEDFAVAAGLERGTGYGG